MLSRFRKGPLRGLFARPATGPTTTPPLFFTPSSRPRYQCSSLCTERGYSFESGRGSKGDKPHAPPLPKAAEAPVEVEDAPAKKGAKEPAGGGRRGGRPGRRNGRTLDGSQFQRPLLPFTPLPPSHLAHAHPKLLCSDSFFSSGRALLEVELPHLQRLSATSEAPDTQPPAFAPEPIHFDAEEELWTGSPSDPAFKAPRSDSVHPRTPPDSHGEDAFGRPDPYETYLVAEPEGPHPDWSPGVTRHLAGMQAFVPPAKVAEEAVELDAEQLIQAEAQARDAGRHPDRVSLATEYDDAAVDSIRYLAPFGFASPDSPLLARIADRAASERSAAGTPAPALPAMSQDPHTLTLAAARFLHTGMLNTQYANALGWSHFAHLLDSAGRSYAFDPARSPSPASKAMEPLPIVTGPAVTLKKGPQIELSIDGLAKEAFASPEEFVTRLKQLLQQHGAVEVGGLSAAKTQRIAAGSWTVDVTEVAASPEAVGRLLASGDPGLADLEAQDEVRRGGWALQRGPRLLRPKWVWMDSVKRKRKRKMNVHKYKKRRKAQKSLRKRQGRE